MRDYVELLEMESYDEFETKGKPKLHSLKKEAMQGRHHHLLRTVLQHLGKLLVLKHTNVLLQWATGVGKSRAALMAAAEIGGRGLIVHKQLVHRKTWTDEVEKWGLQDMLDYTFTTYESLKNHSGIPYDWVIYDEVHAITPARVAFFKSIQARYSIMLSATVPKEKRLHLRKVFSKFHVVTVSLGEAIAWRLLPPVRIITVPIHAEGTRSNKVYSLRFSQKNPVQHITFDEYLSLVNHPTKKRGAVLYDLSYQSDYNYDVICTEREYIQLMNDEMGWRMTELTKATAKARKDPKYIQWAEVCKNRVNLLGATRKRFFSSVKLPAAERIIRELREERKRYVCFADSIKQTESISNHSVHSKRKPQDNLEIVDLFNRGQIDHMLCVKMLNESMNLVNLDVAVILSLNAVDIANIQRIGRSVRGEQPLVIILYVPGSKDHDNLRQLTSDINGDIARVCMQMEMEPWKCIEDVDLARIKSLLV